MKHPNLVFLLLLFVWQSCYQEQSTSTAFNAIPVVNKETPASKLSDYWYQGKAEVSRYTLEQNRYNNTHPGQAIMVFVTEDFLTDLQVKNDYYRNSNSIPILKTNMLRKFPTGIYDYSMMTSVFTPVETEKHPQTLKVSSSSQEWCGHTYMQINHRNKGYEMTLHSYFEGEADKKETVGYALLEDEIYNRIRINPTALPVGKMRMLPSAMVTRLMHLNFQAYEANATLEDYKGTDFEGDNLQFYTIEYPELKRILEIVFEKEAPFEIIGWKDAYPSAFDKKIRTTIAKKTHTVMTEYWAKNGLEDMKLRTDLGLE